MNEIEKAAAGHMRSLADRIERGQLGVSYLSMGRDCVDISTDDEAGAMLFDLSFEVRFCPPKLMVDDGVLK